MHKRRDFLKMAGTLLAVAGCRPEELLGPRCDGPTVPDPPTPGTDVYISSGDLDAKLPNPTEENLAIHLSGAFTTRGDAFARWNLGKDWTVDGQAEVSIDGTADMGGLPFHCLVGRARSVSGLTLRGNHSSLAAGRSQLRTSGVLLYGDGQIDGVRFHDFGSLGSETFVAAVVDGQGPASITNCLYTDSPGSDTQVTVYFIAGDRDQVLMGGNETHASLRGNWVQGHSIYQVRRGLVRNNRTYGARTGYYGDFFATRGITVEGNRFLGCEHGVQLQLSPTAGSDTEAPKYFSHEGYTIGRNTIESTGANVALNTLGPSTATRFIRDIEIDERLSVENVGATDVRRTTGNCERRAA